MGANLGEKLNIVGVCASPHKKGNTSILVESALEGSVDAASEMGLEARTSLVRLAGHRISPCLGCDQCAKQRRVCVIQDDWQELARPLYDPVPDGVVFGSPVYFFNQNALGRCYMERFTSLIKGIWDLETPVSLPDWSCTAGGAVAVGYDRNGGVEFAMNSILQWFLSLGLASVGGFYIGGAGWTGMRNGMDAVKADKHGMESARLVGRRVARTGALLRAGRKELGERANIDLTWRSMDTPLNIGGDDMG